MHAEKVGRDFAADGERLVEFCQRAADGGVLSSVDGIRPEMAISVRLRDGGLSAVVTDIYRKES